MTSSKASEQTEKRDFVPTAQAGFIFLFVVVVVLGLALRFQSSTKSLWLDELHTTELARVSPSQMIEMLKEDFHAPLYYLSVMALDRFGLSGIELRLGSVVWGLLGLWPLVLLLRGSSVERWGLLALVAVYLCSPFQLRYGTELRPYSLLGTLALGLTWAAFDQKASRRCRFWTFLALTVVALYVHYLAATIVTAIGFVRLIMPRSKRLPLGHLILAGTIGVILFLPWIFTMESWLFSDPEALVRRDEISEAERALLPTPPGLMEMKNDLIGIIPRTLAPGASSLGEPAQYMVLIGVGATLFILALGLGNALFAKRSLMGFLGPILSALGATLLIALLCVKFWHRVPIQYFAAISWIWAILAAISISGLRTEKMRVVGTLLLIACLGLSALGEVTGQPRENLEGGVELAAELAKNEDAYLTAIMRQPPHYRNCEVFRVYLKDGDYTEPDDVRASDGRSVVILTRRTNLEDDGGPPLLMDQIRSGRTLTSRVDCGRGVAVYLFTSDEK